MHKGGEINNVQLIDWIGSAEMSHLQNCSVKISKNTVGISQKRRKIETKIEESCGHGGCQSKIEVIVNMQKKSGGGISDGWMGVNQELKLLWGDGHG